MNTVTPTPGELRLRVHRLRLPLYELAGVTRIHPQRLSQMLRGLLPMPPEVAQRIAAALDAEVAAIREAAAP